MNRCGAVSWSQDHKCVFFRVSSFLKANGLGASYRLNHERLVSQLATRQLTRTFDADLGDFAILRGRLGSPRFCKPNVGSSSSQPAPARNSCSIGASSVYDSQLLPGENRRKSDLGAFLGAIANHGNGKVIRPRVPRAGCISAAQIHTSGRQRQEIATVKPCPHRPQFNPRHDLARLRPPGST